MQSFWKWASTNRAVEPHVERNHQMPSTHITSTFHIVFFTKERRQLIIADWRPRLHAYMGGIVKGLDTVPLAIGGVADHAHVLAGLKSKHRLDYFVRDLKADSSAWVHKEFTRLFEWQKGYGAFSVCGTHIANVRSYVESQETHHQSETFQQEYVGLLEKNGVEYAPEYLW
ncbi:MAG TPA: transposase [Pyrinomonadaceae bacterium]|nr:transposase [Pyrinomonadaceae bacterium]